MNALHEDTASFLHAWRERWPEWAIAGVFLSPSQRELAEAWFAMLEEWQQAATHGDEPAPGLAKLAWWQEELRGWAKGARRHPLGRVLQAQAVDWSSLADAMAAYAQLRNAPTNETLARLPQAIADAEAVLFGASRGDASATVAAQILGEVPEVAGTRPRRLLSALQRQRFTWKVNKDESSQRRVPALRTWWQAWKAARG